MDSFGFRTPSVAEEGQRFSRSSIIQLILIGASFAVCNLLIELMMRWISPNDQASVFVYMMFGMMMAQCGVVTLWGVFAPFPFRFRIVVGIWAAFLLFACWIAGVSFSTYSWKPREILNVALCGPLLYFTIQGPMWIAKIFFRWSVQQQPDDDQMIESRPSAHDHQGPMTIAQMMAGTAIIGASIGAARIAASDDRMGSEFAFSLFVFVASAMGIGIVSALPALLLLRARAAKTGLIVLGGYYLMATLIAVISLSLAFAPHSYPTSETIGIFCMLLSFATWLVLPILVLHREGYRLIWGREEADSVDVFDQTHDIVEPNSKSR